MKQSSKAGGKQKFAPLVAIVVALCSIASTAQAEIRPFNADYQVHYLRMHAAQVNIVLEQKDESAWYMSRRSKAVGFARYMPGASKLKLHEQSWFQLSDEQPVPDRFLLEKPSAKEGRRRVEIGFSETHALVSTDDAQKKAYEKSLDSQDQVSAVLAAMLKMQDKQENFELPVMSRRGEEPVSFEVIENVSVQTPAGVFDTVHILQKNKKRHINYWLAVDHSMVPVKIVHQENDDEGVVMSLESLSFSEQ